MDYEVYQYTDEEMSHYFLSEVTGDKRRAYALAKKPDKYFVFQGNYRLPSDNIKKAMTMKQTEETTMSPFMKQKLMNLEEKLYRMEKKIDEAPLVRVVIIAIAILAIVEAYLIL